MTKPDNDFDTSVGPGRDADDDPDAWRGIAERDDDDVVALCQRASERIVGATLRGLCQA